MKVKDLSGIIIFFIVGTSALLVAYGILNQHFILSIIVFISGVLAAYLIQKHNIEEDGLIEFEHLKGIRTPLGEIAVEKGMINVNQLLKILKEHSRTGEMFGEIAVKRGFLTEMEVEKLLKIQKERELISRKKYSNKTPVTKETKTSGVLSHPLSAERENRKDKVTPLPSFRPTLK